MDNLSKISQINSAHYVTPLYGKPKNGKIKETVQNFQPEKKKNNKIYLN